MNFKSIEDRFSGELYYKDNNTDLSVRRVYSTDASEYQELPIAVAIPKDKNDIKILIDFASQNNVTLIPRAAGTSLAGQVVGSGIVVDISKYFSKIIELNVEEKWVKVQPGVIRDDLNVYLKPFGLMFGPETSTANRAMIGGMIGNNSCGLHSIIWGTTRDNLISTDVILSNGEESTFQSFSKKEIIEKSNLEGLEGTIYSNLTKILENENNAKTVIENFPKANIKRRNTGYALDFLLEDIKSERINLCNLLAGSEGTLCFITEAKLKLIDLPPKEVALIAIHTDSINEALKANLIALKNNCAASELVDDFILKFTKDNPTFSKHRSFIKGEPGAILMVEFFANSREELNLVFQKTIEELIQTNIGFHYPILYGDDSKLAWEVRKAGLGLLRNLPGDDRPVNLIEDCAVDPQDLHLYIEKLEVLLKNYGVQYSMYAHAGAGELHVEPIINLKTKEGLALFRNILHDTTKLVKSFTGSLSGEHGDGRLRGEFIPMIMGTEVYKLFGEVKYIFDPQNVFNKGKIVDTPPMDAFLRYQQDKVSSPIKTIYEFSNQGGFLKLAEKCSGSGDCRKTEVSGGTMCPSFMATKEEKDTTRARANILRQFLNNEETEYVSDHQVKAILDLCLSCKACKSECPSNVDVAKMKGEFMQLYHDKHGSTFRSNLIGNFTKQMNLASKLPFLYNIVFSNKFTKEIANRAVGFHPKRSIPKLPGQTLQNWYKKNYRIKGFSKKVHLFNDEFTNYLDVKIGIKFIELLNHLEYEVIIPKHEESGRSFMSKGFIKEAKELANKNTNLLKDISIEEIPLVGIEPSAILSFRDEYLDLISKDLASDALKIAQNSFLFEEWFMMEVEKGNILQNAFTDDERVVLFHGHCHQKALTNKDKSKQVLSFPKNYEVLDINAGCCGMAGSFGYEKEHYELSMKIGELILFPRIRKASEKAIIAASGTSCRHQIKDGINRLALHPIEVLWDARKF